MENQKDFILYREAWIRKESPHKSNKIRIEVAKILLSGGGKFLRNTFNWDKQMPTTFWYIIKDSFGGIDELPTKVRNQVRKSLKSYDFKKVGIEEMIDKGYVVYNESRKRFGYTNGVSKEQFAGRCRSAVKTGQDLWLGIDLITEKAECFAFCRCYDDYCDYISMGVNPDAPKSTYPMYGLIFEMNRYYLNELGLRYVLDGARSITEHSNIQPFLEEKFKFRKAFCDLQIVYHPLLGVAVRLLFPFRRWIKNTKVTAILKQEAWARGLSQ